MSEEVEKKAVHDWLKQQGYPLEMRVAKICADLNLGLFQGEYYLDPSEDKKRETDVIAQYWESSPEKKVEFNVQFICECKSLKGKPKQWLLFSHQHTLIRQPTLLCQTKEAENLMTNLDSVEGFPPAGIFSGTFDSGYALTLANREGNDDVAYAAMAAVMSAATHWKDPPRGLLGLYGAALIQIRIPIIVVSQPIYKASLTKKGELRVQKTPYGYLGFKRGAHAKSPDVFLIHESALEKFIKAVIKEVGILAEACDKRPELFQESFVKGKEAMVIFAKARAKK